MTMLRSFEKADWFELGKRVSDPEYVPNLSENAAAFMDTLKTIVARHGLDAETAFQAIQATGNAAEALALLDEGMPIDYILAMRGKR